MFLVKLGRLLAVRNTPGRFCQPRKAQGVINTPKPQIGLCRQGWVDIQEWGMLHNGWAPVATCKGATTIDFVLISPELVPCLRQVRSWPLFSDHLALGVEIELPLEPIVQQVWPLPRSIDWDVVDWDAWHTQAGAIEISDLNNDAAYECIWRFYEASFDGHCKTPDRLLPSQCRGRAATTSPVQRKAALPLLRPSRPGELCQSTDLLGRLPQKWFLQLRRIQSLVHGLRSGKDTTDAIVYRIELWRSIRFSKGFLGGFQEWWLNRPVQLPGSPPILPEFVPSCEIAERIFCDFEQNYRQLESWHARKRHQILDATVQQHSERLFAFIKPEAKEPLHYLADTKHYNILACSDDQQELLVDDCPVVPLDATCFIDDVPVKVTNIDGTQIKVEHDWLLRSPMDFTVTQHFSSAAAILNQLEKFWSVRWWKEQLPAPSDWTRMFAFADAYFPKKQMPLHPINAGQWLEINKRYTSKSARGLDGVDRHDLLWMPPALMETFTDLLNRCERQGQWPEGLLHGSVYPLPKRAHGNKVSDFRPVILYPMTYRSWSSLRARQCLRFLATFSDGHQVGFLPGREAAEIWLLLQAIIECDICFGRDRCGYVTDVEKAFEAIPRQPIFTLAVRLGIPAQIIAFWGDFLARTSRRFALGQEVGKSMMSNSGFPEGCAMSCVAMAISDLVYHFYLGAYASVTVPLSYVDNLEVLAHSQEDLANGIVCARAWAEMWHLSLDEDKSYVWATTPKLRHACEVLGLPVKTFEKDLGAPMTYGKRASVQTMLHRFESLQTQWPLLKRLRAPEWRKHLLLQQGFWARAFYGCSNCLLGWNHISMLRTAAMKGLRAARAGANPGLKLALLCPMKCDPGFYQLSLVMMTFKRMLRKQPKLLDMWSSFMSKFRGQTSHGPFGKILEVCGLIGWSVQPPGFHDHDGVWCSMLAITDSALTALLEEAWTLKVARDVSSRKDFADLQGIDLHVLRKVQSKLNYGQKCVLCPVRDGSFLDKLQHSKYDLSLEGLCPFCREPDTPTHRFLECPATAAARAEHPEAVDLWSNVPGVTALRLLPNRNPHWDHVKRDLASMNEFEWRSQDHPHVDHLDLFTDGSCWENGLPFAIAAWAVVCANTDKCVCKGTVPGLFQSNDHGEIRAIIAAVSYAARCQIPATIWSDSAFAATGLARLMKDPMDIPEDQAEELWHQLSAELQGATAPITIQHVAAHREHHAEANPIDEWTAYWNGRADSDASSAHGMRGLTFMTKWKQVRDTYYQMVEDMKQLQDFHLAVADLRLQAEPMEEDEDDGVTDDIMREWWLVKLDSEAQWQQTIPASWAENLSRSSLVQTFGLAFCHSIWSGFLSRRLRKSHCLGRHHGLSWPFCGWRSLRMPFLFQTLWVAGVTTSEMPLRSNAEPLQRRWRFSIAFSGWSMKFVGQLRPSARGCLSFPLVSTRHSAVWPYWFADQSCSLRSVRFSNWRLAAQYGWRMICSVPSDSERLLCTWLHGHCTLLWPEPDRESPRVAVEVWFLSQSGFW